MSRKISIHKNQKKKKVKRRDFYDFPYIPVNIRVSLPSPVLSKKKKCPSQMHQLRVPKCNKIELSCRVLIGPRFLGETLFHRRGNAANNIYDILR